MKTIKGRFLAVSSLLASAALLTQSALAQMSTPPATPAELEATYTAAIEGRVDDILKTLSLTNSAAASKVHDLVIAQYRVMRSRDDLINAKLEAAGKEVNYSNRESELEDESKPLHDHFFAELGKVLTPEQIEKVKDKMTYGKVKVTYDAYLDIIPGLTDADKTKIMDLLKAAREKAVDGGSASEKSEIFNVYKDKINDYLNANGHDVAKAYKDWNAKKALAQSNQSPTVNTNAVR
jgi:Spy/CpxP family protein refolding chaperone